MGARWQIQDGRMRRFTDGIVCCEIAFTAAEGRYQEDCLCGFMLDLAQLVYLWQEVAHLLEIKNGCVR
jgi:hypothetical protein